MTTAELNRVTRPSWSEFFPDGYLREYYSGVATDEKAALKYLVDLFATECVDGRVLDFGCGPTVHRAIAAAKHADCVTMADLLPRNLDAVRSWVDGTPGYHDWTAYTSFILECEGVTAPSEDELRLREQRTRRRIIDLRRGDARLSDPLGAPLRESFDVVIAGFCLETVGSTTHQFVRAMRRVLSLVAPGGLGIVMTLGHCAGYRLNGSFFDCYPVRELDLIEGFRAARFGEASVELHSVPEHRRQGYTQMFFAHARRPVI